MRSLIDIQDLTVGELDELVAVAEDIIENPKKYAEICHGKKLATLFFEPSTRTRLSFEAAMYELGGNVLSVSSAGSSSAAKEAPTHRSCTTSAVSAVHRPTSLKALPTFHGICCSRTCVQASLRVRPHPTV